MFTAHVSHLICIHCASKLNFTDVSVLQKEKIEEGELVCIACKATYPVTKGIPRFVPKDHYTQAFGYQWLQHAKTQYDSFTGMPVTENRIRIETKWPETTPEEKILEVGSGSGRFTEQLIKKKGFIISFDASVAVEANYAAHGNNPSVLIVQADIYNLPFKDGYFDRLVCIGVLQHTPDPKKSIVSIVAKVRSGGSCVMDIYRRHPWYRHMWNTRFWVRPFVKNMKPERLYKLCTLYINMMWPLACVITKLPYGRSINQKLLVPELMSSSKYKKFSNELHKQWALLHLFDWLNPTYDQPQHIKTFHAWLTDAGLSHVETNYGYGGIEGRGIRT
jgi:ubiquinone/menaquinone biosynthesis C-methylase UbiE/uncharacterized protein YbaR (Trm112 family)